MPDSLARDDMYTPFLRQMQGRACPAPNLHSFAKRPFRGSKRVTKEVGALGGAASVLGLPNQLVVPLAAKLSVSEKVGGTAAVSQGLLPRPPMRLP